MNPHKQKTLISLKKAHSHLAKITSMIESDHYCIDIMQQNLAVIGLLKSAHQQLMKNHLNSCFKSAIDSKHHKKKQQMIDEILKVTDLSNR
jgi:DNA-binding FrmR family transcriptional regulator